MRRPEFGSSPKKRYQKTDTIGKGGYGIVYKGYDIVCKEIVAIKKIRTEVFINII